ncbi:unnamed protein product [Nesidiocoris tenuis]|uniref:VWFC domain-containing protein n=1 Tax=Nesidiocoris tenuis TaxID=355587 RepID=A0A6H5H3C8_9HEMI|nr:unnamed protein product [Nesidiocoris tenuis]
MCISKRFFRSSVLILDFRTITILPFTLQIWNDRCMDFRSAHAFSMKVACARELIGRALRLSSTQYHEDNKVQVKNMLLANGYPVSLVSRLVSGWSCGGQRRERDHAEAVDTSQGPEAVQKFYGGLTYVEGVSTKLRGLLEKELPSVKIAFKYNNKISRLHTRLKAADPIQLQSGVVYKVPCKGCSTSYVGHTISYLRVRMARHARDCRGSPEDGTMLSHHAIETGHEFDFDVPVALLTSSTTEKTWTSSAVGHLDNYGCVLDDNTFYADGAQVPSDPKKPCELCYCIRNQTACVMQECTLNVEGCKPVYQEGVCCPVRYDCANGTVPADVLQAKPTPGADSLSITEKPHDEDKSIEEIEKHDESVEHSAEGVEHSAEGVEHSAESVEQAQPEKPDIAASPESDEASSEDSKIQAEIEIITTPAPQDLSEGSTQAAEQESGALLAGSGEPSVPIAEQDHAEETHDAEATTPPEHYTEISVVNVEMNTLHPHPSHPEAGQEETASEDDGKETSQPAEAQEITTQPTIKQSEEVSQSNDDHASAEGEAEVPLEPVEHQETIVPEAPQTSSQLEDEKPNEESGNEIPETTPAPAPSTSSTTEAEPEELPRIPGEGSCLHKGITYAPNTEVASTDPCKRCRCVNSIVTCKELECAEPPFSQNSNCAPMPPADGACCPTYLCEQTPSQEPEAENHMSIDKIDMVVPDEEGTAEESIPTTVASIVEDENIPSMAGIPEHLVPGTDEINLTPDHDDVAHESPASTQDEGKEQDTHPELAPAEPEVHEDDGAIAATTSRSQDSNDEDQAVIDTHSAAHDAGENSGEPSEEIGPVTTTPQLENIPEEASNTNLKPSGPSEVEQTQDGAEGQASTNEESAPSTDSPQEPSELQSPNETPELSGTAHDSAPETDNSESDTGVPTATPEAASSDGENQETHSTNDNEKVEESNSEEGTTAGPILASESEASQQGQTHDEVASNEPSPHDEVVTEQISTEASAVPNAEPDSLPSESSESGHLPIADDKENDLSASNEENIQITENTAQGSDTSAASEVENVERLQTTEGPSGTEEPVEAQPIVTAGPPVLFPDISHQGAPIRISGPPGIDTEQLSPESQRFGETESPVEQPSATEQAQISEETSPNSSANGDQSIKDELPPSTEGPNLQGESNVENSSELAPIEASNAHESSQNPQSDNLENGNEVLSSELLPSHDEDSTGQTLTEIEESPATELNQAAPEASSENSDTIPSELDATESQPHSNEDAAPVTDQPEEGPAPESDNIQTGHVVTHGDLPSLPESSQHLEENSVQPEHEPEHEGTNQPEHVEEPAPQSPEVPESDKTTGEAELEQQQSATQVPESDEVVTHVDAERPQPVLEIANQVIDAGSHDLNAVEGIHQAISEEQKPEDNTETEKSQASDSEGEPAAVEESAASLPQAPESQPDQPAHEDLPVPSIPEHPEHTIPEGSEHAVAEGSLAESAAPEEPHSEEKPAEDHHEVPAEQLPEYTTPGAIPSETEQQQTDQHQTAEGNVDDELPVEKHPEADTQLEELPAPTPAEHPAEEHAVEDNLGEQIPTEEHTAEDVPVEQSPAEEHPSEEHPIEEENATGKSPTVEEHAVEEDAAETSGQEQDVGSVDSQQPDQHPGEVHSEPEQTAHSETSPDIAQEETGHQSETTPLPQEDLPQEPQPAEQQPDAGSPSGSSDTSLTSETTQHEAGQATEDQQAGDNQETLPVESSEDGSPAAPIEAQQLEVNSETTLLPSSEQTSEASAIPEQPSEVPSSSEPAEEHQSISEQNQSIAGDKAESEHAAEAAGLPIPEQTLIHSAQPEDSESQPTGSEVDTSGLGPITAPEELNGETGPSAPETAPSAPETAPEQPSAPESQPSSPGQDEVQPTSPEGSAQTSHAEEISSQEESDKVGELTPGASSSPLSEHPSGSPAPPVELPSTEGPLMPGLQNWAQKPYHPTSHQHPAPEQQSHLPDDSHYPSPPYDTDYEDEDSVSYGPGTCRYGGKVYLSAQQIPRDDPCDFCFCFRSDIICLQQSCPPPIKGCYQETIKGFCCPRYECHVSMATVVNITTTSTTTTTTVPPHFLSHLYNGSARKAGCQVKGVAYRVGDRIEETSGPCLDCR